MNNYYEPILKGEIGKMEFELFDGLKTKSFYNVGEFDEVFGQFPILNEKEEIVEYMDLLGNFTENRTELAKYFYQYCISIVDVPVIKMGRYKMFYTGISEFPSKYLLDERTKKIIKAEEKRRFKLSCKCHKFDSLIEMLRYRKYVNSYIKEKLQRAEEYAEELKIINENQNIF